MSWPGGDGLATNTPPPDALTAPQRRRPRAASFFPAARPLRSQIRILSWRQLPWSRPTPLGQQQAHRQMSGSIGSWQDSQAGWAGAQPPARKHKQPALRPAQRSPADNSSRPASQHYCRPAAAPSLPARDCLANRPHTFQFSAQAASATACQLTSRTAQPPAPEHCHMTGFELVAVPFGMWL